MFLTPQIPLDATEFLNFSRTVVAHENIENALTIVSEVRVRTDKQGHLEYFIEADNISGLSKIVFTRNDTRTPHRFVVEVFKRLKNTDEFKSSDIIGFDKPFVRLNYTS